MFAVDKVAREGDSTDEYFTEPAETFVVGMHHFNKTKNIHDVIQVFKQKYFNTGIIHCRTNAVSIQEVEGASLIRSIKNGATGFFVINTERSRAVARRHISNTLAFAIERLLECKLSPLLKNGNSKDLSLPFEFSIRKSSLVITVRWCVSLSCWYGYFQDTDKFYRSFVDLRKTFF